MIGSQNFTTRSVVERMATSIGAEFEIAPDMILGKTRVGDTALARQVLMVMLTRKGFTLKQAADELNRNYGTVAHAIKTVQNMRDTDARFDETFRRIEDEFSTMPSINHPKAWAKSSLGDLAPPYYF